MVNPFECKKCSVPPAKSIYRVFKSFKDIDNIFENFIFSVYNGSKSFNLNQRHSDLFLDFTNVFVISKRLFHLFFESRINFSFALNCIWLCTCRISFLRGLLRNILIIFLTFPITLATNS